MYITKLKELSLRGIIKYYKDNLINKGIKNLNNSYIYLKNIIYIDISSIIYN